MAISCSLSFYANAKVTTCAATRTKLTRASELAEVKQSFSINNSAFFYLSDNIMTDTQMTTNRADSIRAARLTPTHQNVITNLYPLHQTLDKLLANLLHSNYLRALEGAKRSAGASGK